MWLIQVSLSKTYEKVYGKDYEGAFIAIKKDIVELLDKAADKDYEYLKHCRINSSYRYKLLAIYYPDDYFPVCTKSAL